MTSPRHTRDLSPRRIHYLQRKDIDIEKWDACIARSPAGFLYSNSFFLDIITGSQWDALVSDDYTAVMPLPKKKKYGLTYSYIPPLIGQLGIIGADPAPATITDDFLRSIPRSLLLVDTLINEYNPAPSLPGVEFIPRLNLVLPLDAEYPILSESYTDDAKKNLRRTERAGLVPEYNIPVPAVIDLYRNEYGSLNPSFTASVYGNIASVAAACIEKRHGFTLGIRDAAKNLHAAAFFGKDDRRIYYLLGAPGPDGRRYNAVHALIDEVIRKYAASGLELDFEGSDIPSVAGFYRKFGPASRVYHQVRITRYPRWLRRLTGIPAPASPSSFSPDV